MHDPMVIERLKVILTHTVVILERISQIRNANEFISSKEGELVYDSVITRLQAIGENVKKVEKLNPQIANDIFINTKNIIRFRDLISHHYEFLDHEVIFNVCKNEIPEIHRRVLNYLNTLPNETA
jgi:uncharacterized protein with HEPN domain